MIYDILISNIWYTYIYFWYTLIDFLVWFSLGGKVSTSHPIWSFSRRPQKSSWASVAGRAPKTAFSALGNGPHWVYCFFVTTRKWWAVVKDGIPVIIWDSGGPFFKRPTYTPPGLWTQTWLPWLFFTRARVRCLCSVGMMVFNKLSVVHFPAVPGDPFSLDGDALDVGWNTIPSWEKRREGGSNPISPPSGKHTKNYGKSPFLMGKIHYKSPFSIAFCIVYQRVIWNALKMVPNMSKSPTSTMLAADVFNMRGKESPRRMGEMNFDCDQCSGNPCQPSGWPRVYGGPEW